MGGRAGRHALPRPPPRSPGRPLHRLPHRHPGRRAGARLRALPPDPLPADLLPPRLGAGRLRGPGRAVRPPRGRLRAAAARDPPPRARGLARARGGRDHLPGRARDLRRARAVPAHPGRAAGPGLRRPALRPPRRGRGHRGSRGGSRASRQRDTGIAAATDGLASVVGRPTGRTWTVRRRRQRPRRRAAVPVRPARHHDGPAARPRGRAAGRRRLAWPSRSQDARPGRLLRRSRGARGGGTGGVHDRRRKLVPRDFQYGRRHRGGPDLRPMVRRVRARNDAQRSENAIHDHDVAQQYGFEGGLVPGVTVYAYTSVLPPSAGARTGWTTAR